jgi:hypothetical protein
MRQMPGPTGRSRPTSWTPSAPPSSATARARSSRWIPTIYDVLKQAPRVDRAVFAHTVKAPPPSLSRTHLPLATSTFVLAVISLRMFAVTFISPFGSCHLFRLARQVSTSISSRALMISAVHIGMLSPCMLTWQAAGAMSYIRLLCSQHFVIYLGCKARATTQVKTCW